MEINNRLQYEKHYVRRSVLSRMLALLLVVLLTSIPFGAVYADDAESAPEPVEEISVEPDVAEEEIEIIDVSEEPTSADDTSLDTDDEIDDTDSDDVASDETVAETNDAPDTSSETTYIATSPGQIQSTTSKKTLAALDEDELEELKESLRQEIEDELRRGCLVLADGGYYCVPSDEVSDTDGSMYVADPDVTAEAFQAVSGERSIALHNELDELMLTDGETDVLFPEIDQNQKIIAWQELIDERWQIMAYDVITDETVQLTNTEHNNMHPTTHDGYVVWQSWIDTEDHDGNWEIMMAHRDAIRYIEKVPNDDEISDDDEDDETDFIEDYFNTDPKTSDDYQKISDNTSWVTTQLTNNDTHDMLPRIANNLVSWQQFIDGSWHIFVYDIIAQETRQLTSGDGKNETPRFALTWKSYNKNGSQVLAYDLASGEVTTLSDDKELPPLPEPLPELPIDDEDIAIANNETVLRTDELDSDDDDEDDTDISDEDDDQEDNEENASDDEISDEEDELLEDETPNDDTDDELVASPYVLDLTDGDVVGDVDDTFVEEPTVSNDEEPTDEPIDEPVGEPTDEIKETVDEA